MRIGSARRPPDTSRSAQSVGRVFASGPIQDRYAQLRTYAETNRNQPVAFVVTDADLTTAGEASIPGDVPVEVTDLRAAIDSAGVHLSGGVNAQILTINAASDISVGAVDGRLVMRVRSLTASPLPAGLLDGVRGPLENSLNEFSSGFPYRVRQVLMRQGCLSIMGTTP